jgi:hypothetical protein
MKDTNIIQIMPCNSEMYAIFSDDHGKMNFHKVIGFALIEEFSERRIKTFSTYQDPAFDKQISEYQDFIVLDHEYCSFEGYTFSPATTETIGALLEQEDESDGE